MKLSLDIYCIRDRKCIRLAHELGTWDALYLVFDSAFMMGLDDLTQFRIKDEVLETRQ